jgi:hypothetical protein
MKNSNITGTVPMSQKKSLTNEERRHKLLNDPEIYNKIQQMAKSLDKNLGPEVDILVDIEIGARFKDLQTGIIYIYESIVQPFHHSDIIAMVFELAGRPLAVLSEISYMLISEDVGYKPGPSLILPDAPELFKGGEYEPERIQGPRKIVSGRDFVAYFAVGKWKLLQKPIKSDPDDILQGEKLAPPPLITNM